MLATRTTRSFHPPAMPHMINVRNHMRNSPPRFLYPSLNSLHMELQIRTVHAPAHINVCLAPSISEASYSVNVTHGVSRHTNINGATSDISCIRLPLVYTSVTAGHGDKSFSRRATFIAPYKSSMLSAATLCVLSYGRL